LRINFSQLGILTFPKLTFYSLRKFTPKHNKKSGSDGRIMKWEVILFLDILVFSIFFRVVQYKAFSTQHFPQESFAEWKKKKKKNKPLSFI